MKSRLLDAVSALLIGLPGAGPADWSLGETIPVQVSPFGHAD